MTLNILFFFLGFAKENATYRSC